MGIPWVFNLVDMRGEPRDQMVFPFVIGMNEFKDPAVMLVHVEDGVGIIVITTFKTPRRMSLKGDSRLGEGALHRGIDIVTDFLKRSRQGRNGITTGHAPLRQELLHDEFRRGRTADVPVANEDDGFHAPNLTITSHAKRCSLCAPARIMFEYMLTRLVISNLAILENVDVSFKEGFTVLTGGTGAGKSLVIDSLSLLLGARASTELIRTGEEKASIKGYFRVDSSRLSALLTRFEIPFIDNEILIERVIGRTKSTIKANGVALTLQQLSQIAKQLADIHNQFDFAKILNPENYLDIIDGFSFDQTSLYKKEYGEKLDLYRAAKEEHEKLLIQKAKIEASQDFYEFQLKELEEADLQENEEAEIASEVALLRNYDHVYSLFQNVDSLVHEDFLDRLYELNKVLTKLSSYQPRYQEVQEKIDERYYELDDIFQSLKKDFRNLDYDPERLNVLEQRSSDIAALKRKYKKSVPELIAYREELHSLLSADGGIDAQIEEKVKEMAALRHECFVKGQELTVLRKKIARSIEKEIKRNLDELLLTAEFSVVFSPVTESDDDTLFQSTGIDRVDFLIETNVGEGLKSLSKVVSGGEASRIMLAFKAVFIKANKVATVIFDEIDTGLSGEAAQSVANKIKEISLSSQVIAITHMPQVASISDHAILIKKEVTSGRTSTKVKELTLDEKIHEVAYLISGGKVTEKQLEYAKEMVLSR